MSDTKLLKNILYNNASTDKLIRENYEPIYKYCYYHLKNSYTAQDLTQDVFLKFLTNLEKYLECGKVRNYLYVIARNAINDFMRKPKEISFDDIMEEKTEIENMDVITNRIMVLNALDKLGDMEKEIIILRYYQELRLKDIANIVSLPISTVRYKLKQAEKELEKELESET